MPLILRQGKGHILKGMSAMPNTVKPLGFSKSEAILDSSLLGEIPMEQDKPVACLTLFLICCPSAIVSPGTSVKSI